METTFITIHDLTPDARILYASNSISDILGYKPSEIVGTSCWEYFHPDEIPFAQAIHGRGIQLDKAAVLNYCQIKNCDGLWVGCECVFTIVYDVLVGCTSIYRRGPKSDNRRLDAPIIRQLFSSSPKDPRYHMLTYISSKFSQGPKPHIHEPRAALFLNRFTRTLTIMYATNGLQKLLGISADELVGQSFYFCIQEGCLPEAVRCLESAKANDSIAYLRFWYRDPRQDDPAPEATMSDAPPSIAPEDESMDVDDEDDDGGGVQLASAMDTDGDESMLSASSSTPSVRAPRPRRPAAAPHAGAGITPSSRSTLRDSSSQSKTPDPVFDSPAGVGPGSSSSRSSDVVSRQLSQNSAAPGKPFPPPAAAALSAKQRAATGMATPTRSVELEAVVSCTSDGLVVVLRGARPFVFDSLRPAPPRPTQPRPLSATAAAGMGPSEGVFAAPWSVDPPPGGAIPPGAGAATMQPSAPAAYVMPARAAAAPSADPMETRTRSFMDTIRDVAVFAWALTGINGSLAQYSRGKPRPGAQPYGGLPVWEGDV